MPEDTTFNIIKLIKKPIPKIGTGPVRLPLLYHCRTNFMKILGNSINCVNRLWQIETMIKPAEWLIIHSINVKSKLPHQTPTNYSHLI
jgi:hypothetical protein